MKHRMIALFILLSVFLTLFVFAGCEEPDQPTAAVPSTGSDNVPDKEPEVNTIPVSEQLIEEIKQYLFGINAEILIDSLALSTYLNIVKGGEQVGTCVSFDPTAYYYVCGYYDAGEEYIEDVLYCCRENYTWIGIEHAGDIPADYNGQEFIVAFQVNKAQSCNNLLLEQDAGMTMECCQLYHPEFTDGVNVAAPLQQDYAFLCLTDPGEKTIYYFMDKRYHRYNTFPCVAVDGEQYVSIHTYTTYTDGHRSDADLKEEFGEYYDALMGVMITDRYSVTADNGNVRFYGLFEITDIADILRK